MTSAIDGWFAYFNGKQDGRPVAFWDDYQGTIQGWVPDGPKLSPASTIPGFEGYWFHSQLEQIVDAVSRIE